jgi:hypothetical protein
VEPAGRCNSRALFSAIAEYFSKLATQAEKKAQQLESEIEVSDNFKIYVRAMFGSLVLAFLLLLVFAIRVSEVMLV